MSLVLLFLHHFVPWLGKKIQDELLPKIKNAAEKGKTNIDYEIPTTIDYKFAIDYIKYLGYKIMYIKNYSIYVTINVSW